MSSADDLCIYVGQHISHTRENIIHFLKLHSFMHCILGMYVAYISESEAWLS